MTTLGDAAAFNAIALRVVNDATSALNIIYGLAGSFGRYAAPVANPAIASEADAITVASAARASASKATAALLATVQVSGDVPSAAQAVLDATLAAMNAPSDRMRACLQLAATPGTSQLAILCRRLSVIALAAAASDYQPSSYDNAQAILQQVLDALDVEITAAGDAEDDPSFNALRTLRVAVASDLMTRGSTLAPLREAPFGANLPALVVAQMLYGDATRADELVRRVDPVHPLFMPATMQVLAN